MRRPISATVLVVLLAAGAAAAAPSKSRPTREILGEVVAPRPDRSDAGTWNGTWYYGSRDFNVVLWVRTADGKPQIKLRSLNRNTGEGFETDWDGQASYVYQGWPGVFSLSLTTADDRTLIADWRWELQTSTNTRLETATVTAWRFGDGRQMVLDFTNFKRAHVTAEAPTPAEVHADFFWSFRKASTRLSAWDELPF